jgi:hypothetical protein
MVKYINKFVNTDGRTVHYIDSTTCCGKRLQWLHGEKPEHCPVCGNQYFDKPGLEFKLFTYQDEFLQDYARTKSTRILGEKMFPLILEYAENLIKALLKGKACISRESLREKANDAATMLIEVRTLNIKCERALAVICNGSANRLLTKTKRRIRCIRWSSSSEMIPSSAAQSAELKSG